MRKSLLIEKIKRKYTFFRKKNYEKFINKNIERYDFIYEIIDFNKLSPENITKINENNIAFLKIKQEFQKTHSEDALNSIYKKILLVLENLIKEIDAYSLMPTKNDFLREYQLKTVKYCNDICKMLEKNGFQYFITSGTLIGTLRHKGFIPWDDDIDIGMMRQDYEALKKYLKENYLEIDVSKITDINDNNALVIDKFLKRNPNKMSFLITHSYIQIIKGTSLKDYVVLDIFPHDYYSEEYTIEEHRNLISKIRIKRDSLKNYAEKRDYVINEIAKIKNIVKESNKIYYGLDSLDTYLFFMNKFMDKDTIFPLRKITFEGKEFYAPNKMEEYIEFQYKNWQNIPKGIDIAPDLAKRLKKEF